MKDSLYGAKWSRWRESRAIWRERGDIWREMLCVWRVKQGIPRENPRSAYGCGVIGRGYGLK